MGQKGNVNRLLDPRWGSARNAGWKLWDRDGRLWEPVAEDLDRERTEVLFGDPTVPVAIAQESRGLEWIAPEKRRACWGELESRAFDPSWTWETKRLLPLSAVEFVSKGDRLLLFVDND
jgi:hypothetical protein